jgi:hypothetical protein
MVSRLFFVLVLQTYARHLARYLEQSLLAMSAPNSLLLHGDRDHEFTCGCEAVKGGGYPHVPQLRIDGMHALSVIPPARDRFCTAIPETYRYWKLEGTEPISWTLTSLHVNASIIPT